jgi:hypothetical protein
MRMCRVPAVIIAVVIGGVGLAACGASGSAPSAVGSAATGGSAAALTGTPGASPTSALTSTPASSPTPAASATHKHSPAAEPSVTATASARSTKSAHATSSPHPTSSKTTSSGTHNFTVPAISGDNVVTAYGSYSKIGTARVKVTMCAKQTGKAFSVGAIALVYSASGSSHNIGATILTGPGNSTCVSNTFILYTAHLKVHAFIGGSNGTIVKTGPVLTIY